MRRRWFPLLTGLLAVALVSGSDGAPPRCAEQSVRELALAGPLAQPGAEISGLAWWGEQLVLLPQYPGRLGERLFVLPRKEIEAYVTGERSEPLRPRPLPFDVPQALRASIDGFDGFEALTFVGERVFLTVEAERSDRGMGWLLSGRIEREPTPRVVIEGGKRRALAAQTDASNVAYEALAARGERLLALYESNGRNNSAAHAKLFDAELAARGELDVAPLEYRLTDVTDADDHGRFWALNYWWPGHEARDPASCPLTAKFGLGPTHARSKVVERLVELRWTEDGVEPTGRAPLLFRLREDGRARNWEGVARLGKDGFLVATDEHPGSILGFVPLP